MKDRIHRIFIIASFFLGHNFCGSAQTFYGASVAKRGNGNYKGSIYWINWDLGDTPDGRPGEDIPSGTERTVTTPQGITYTIRITKINGNNNNIQSYAPGQYQYDDIKTGYNWYTSVVNGPQNVTPDLSRGNAFPGFTYNFSSSAVTNAYDDIIDAHNSIIGIRNTVNGQLVNFRVSVTASVGSVGGMVAVGAESLGYLAGFTESDGFTTNGGVWQSLEKIQNSYIGTLAAGSFLTRGDATNTGKTVNTYNPGSGSAAAEGPGEVIWFSKGANQIDVSLKGGGSQAIAIGFLGTYDFGDAPSSYGTATHQLDVAFTGASIPTTNTSNIILANQALATRNAPTISIGSVVDVDADQFYSADLSGDDTHDLDDEDGMPNPNKTLTLGGNSISFSVPAKNTSGSAVSLWGWLDANLNGTFDTNERSAPTSVPNGTNGNVNLIFSNLSSTFSAFKSYPLRLRLAQAIPADQTGNNIDEGASGGAISGEVEDHFVRVREIATTGKIFNDINKNGLLDASESLYTGTDMFVYIIDNTNTIVSKAQVVNGNYTIDGLPLGNISPLNAKLVASAQNLVMGAQLATAGVPPSGYSKTGEDLTQAGSNINNNGNNTDFITLFTGTTTTGIQNVNFGVYPLVLAVNFGNIEAYFRNNSLVVNWQTLKEENNDHFEIEGSIDGIIFKPLGVIKSKAENGNSSSTLQYNYIVSASTTTMSGGILMLIVAISIFALSRRKKFIIPAALAVLAFSSIFYSCKKNSADVEANRNFFIRIKQVDIDGTETYSKVIKVIQE